MDDRWTVGFHKWPRVGDPSCCPRGRPEQEEQLRLQRRCMRQVQPPVQRVDPQPPELYIRKSRKEEAAEEEPQMPTSQKMVLALDIAKRERT